MSRTRRRPYRRSRAFDRSCRNAGSCPWCRGNRLHAAVREITRANERLREFVDAPPAEPGTPDECDEYEDDDVDPSTLYCQGCGALPPRSLCTPTCEVQCYPSIPDDCPTCAERRPGCACDRSALAEAMAADALEYGDDDDGPWMEPPTETEP
jgi:hypothetical protein